MLYLAPPIWADEQQALDRIADLRRRLGHMLSTIGRPAALLERTALARAIQGSVGIDGRSVRLDDALAGAEEPVDVPAETWAAMVGYRDALRYVRELADDAHFVLDATFLRSLHFLMTGYDLGLNPGRWRPGPVRDDSTGPANYEPPDAGRVPGLVDGLVDGLTRDEPTVPAPIRAALAHLNLALVRPFSAANGRMARCLHTLLLARDGIVGAAFTAVEEYLGGRADVYRAGLAAVGGGHWQPDRDARPWIRFMLTAQYRQLQTLLRRVGESGALCEQIESTLAGLGLPGRAMPVLHEAASGRRVRRGTYLAVVERPLSDAVATRDLRALAAAGLLTAEGENRGRCYRATPVLAALRERSRLRTDAEDGPFGPGETLF